MYVNKSRMVVVSDRSISFPMGHTKPSDYEPGKWFVALWIPGFANRTAYAVIDDFGSLVEVPA